ncbi:hypothetical protein AA103581_1921 [Gluconobacter wancherniae NBRC 103581]|nr:hypothetical protein AA103581_1921 [Gluconobacter wancherniae NBRC 103581]
MNLPGCAVMAEAAWDVGAVSAVDADLEDVASAVGAILEMKVSPVAASSVQMNYSSSSKLCFMSNLPMVMN